MILHLWDLLYLGCEALFNAMLVERVHLFIAYHFERNICCGVLFEPHHYNSFWHQQIVQRAYGSLIENNFWNQW